MPKSELETKIDKATHENNVAEDWGLIMDIVDQINHSNTKKEIIKIFIKKLNDKDPHVIEHTLTLLNACVCNCDRGFKLEVCSRIFVEELRNFIIKKRYEKLCRSLALMLEKWTKEPDFKNDPALNLIPTLYMELKKQGVDFGPETSQTSSSKVMKQQDILERKEEEELEKAIQLSLKESQAKTKPSTSASNSTPFGQLMQTTQSISESYIGKQVGGAGRRRVKALYDFEAAEDNEITFKAGDILFLSDDSDPNWWKGFDVNGTEGLFPSNFVTFDLNEKIEVYDPKTDSVSKKVSFNENVDVNVFEGSQTAVKKFVIDEKKIDECIELLQNADPTGEIQPDTQELVDLEEECYMMGPLIDKKLQDIDKKHAELEDLNLKILEAFQLYNDLMKESISKQTALINSSQIPVPGINPLGNGVINYAAAPPSLEANSLNFANKLNSLAGYASLGASNGFNSSQTSMGMNPVGYPSNIPGGVSSNPGLNMGNMPSSGYSASYSNSNQFMGLPNGGVMNQGTNPNGAATTSANIQPQIASYSNFN